MGIQKSNFNVIQEHLQETSVKKHGLFFAITNPRKFAAHDAVTEDRSHKEMLPRQKDICSKQDRSPLRTGGQPNECTGCVLERRVWEAGERQAPKTHWRATGLGCVGLGCCKASSVELTESLQDDEQRNEA